MGESIYEKYKYANLVELDFVGKIQEGLRKGIFYIRPSDQKVCTDIKSTWNVKHSRERKCMIWRVLFDYFEYKDESGKIIGCKADRCMNCWKIVVRPRTVDELFQLHDLQELLDYPSKCGMEERPGVHALYGGYFYTDSLEEGRERYKEVRAAVDSEISPKISIILKRGCTEFEEKFGRSNQWQYTNADKFWEDQITLHFDMEQMLGFDQAGIIKINVMRRWHEYAWKHGDKTCMKFNDGGPFKPPVITYHKEEE